VPVFNRANEHLPQWLRIRGELRERIEGFQSGIFVPDRADYYALSRVRLNVAATANEWLSFQTSLHDARVATRKSARWRRRARRSTSALRSPTSAPASRQ
jgi:hypothetical protein